MQTGASYEWIAEADYHRPRRYWQKQHKMTEGPPSANARAERTSTGEGAGQDTSLPHGLPVAGRFRRGRLTGLQRDSTSLIKNATALIRCSTALISRRTTRSRFQLGELSPSCGPRYNICHHPSASCFGGSRRQVGGY